MEYTLQYMAPTWFVALMLTLLGGLSFWLGYREGKDSWKDRAEWLLAQRTVEQQMHKDGWHL